MEEIKIDIQELTIKCNLPVLEPKKFEETWIFVWDEGFLMKKILDLLFPCPKLGDSIIWDISSQMELMKFLIKW